MSINTLDYLPGGATVIHYDCKKVIAYVHNASQPWVIWSIHPATKICTNGRYFGNFGLALSAWLKILNQD